MLISFSEVDIQILPGVGIVHILRNIHINAADGVHYALKAVKIHYRGIVDRNGKVFLKILRHTDAAVLFGIL